LSGGRRTCTVVQIAEPFGLYRQTIYRHLAAAMTNA